MKITVFGGTFDPPHLGHSQIARALLEQGKAEEVWFLPVGEHAFDKKFTAAVHRVAMVQLILEEHQRLEMYELEQPGMSITYDTLVALAEKYPQHQFSFVIGSDNLAKFDQWHHYQAMLKRFAFYVYPRAGVPNEPLYPGMGVLAEVPPVAISSTQVRAAVQVGESIEMLVKPAVAAYIEEQKLYR